MLSLVEALTKSCQNLLQVFGTPSIGKDAMNIRAIIEFDEETRMYVASWPEFNHASAFGSTEEEALKELSNLVQFMLKPLPKKFLKKPGKKLEFRYISLPA